MNETEFILDDKGKITEIKQSYANGMQQDPPITITDKNEINDKIKEIFGDKNNIAIKNIIHELDEERINLITNGHPELLKVEDMKQEQDEIESQNNPSRYHLCEGMCYNSCIGYDEYGAWHCF